MIINLRDRPQTPYRDGVVQATQIAPTVWPMIFSAILGGMLKNLAHRKMQDGARMGLIEHLMASQTVFGALKAAVQFDTFSLATLLLLPLWALSPVGGQAALRSLSLEGGTAETTTDFSVEHEYLRRARLPMIDLLPDYDEHSSEWLEGPQDRVLSFASAFGIPFIGLPSQDTGNASSTIQSAYTGFQCDSEWMAGGEFDAYLDRVEPSFQIIPVSGSNSNRFGGYEGTEPSHEFQTTMPFASEHNKFSDRTAQGPNGTECDVPERPLLFGHLVDVEVSCLRGSAAAQLQCAARRVRRSRDESHLCPSITEIDLMNGTGWNYDPLNYMMGVFSNSLDGQPPSPAEQFLFNPAGVMKNGSWLHMSVQTSDYNMTLVPPAVFQSRLTMLWNTRSMATKDNGLLSGFELTQSPVNNAGRGRDSPLLINETATWSYDIEPVYRLHLGWAVAFLASDAALFLLALLALFTKLRTGIPEILGYVSSLTRHSPYVTYPVTSPGSTLDGCERSQSLRNAWIRMQDVESDNNEAGRLAVTLTSEKTGRERDWERRGAMNKAHWQHEPEEQKAFYKGREVVGNGFFK
ncbi:hypothetical protein ACJZ2D_012615 [Fusarium nematophilum]